ncbi:hypothetical protein [Parasphingorhabdus sp.]|uniref:hypothetical protein n=1 Tax=Parasphingorhabdus sp. TaxID=2709688 RepID=UPI003267C06F
MNRNISMIVLLPVLGLLSACGNRGGLEPAKGQSLPPAAYGEAEPATSDQLLEPSTQARPERSDELLRRSEKRQDDKFDLPPPG